MNSQVSGVNWDDYLARLKTDTSAIFPETYCRWFINIYLVCYMFFLLNSLDTPSPIHLETTYNLTLMRSFVFQDIEGEVVVSKVGVAAN